MNIDWKSVTKENVESLRPIPWAYCSALINLKLWDKYCQTFYDDSMIDHVVGTLLKTSVRKSLLKDMEEDKIIHLLDTVNPLIRRHLLNILIEQADRCPVSISVGQNLLKNISQHLWGYELTKEIFSLQPYDLLKTAFQARIKALHAQNPLMFWKYATDPSNSYIEKTKNSSYIHKSNFQYFTSSYLANARQLKKREKFGDFIADLYIEGLEALQSDNFAHIEDSKYYDFVYLPIFKTFQDFSEVWQQNKNVYKKVREALSKFPFHLTSFTPIISFMLGSEPVNQYFNFKYFFSHNFLDSDDFIFGIFPACLKEDFKLPLEKTKHVRNFISNLPGRIYGNNIPLYRCLQSISLSPTIKNDKTSKCNDLSFIWPKLLQYLEDYIIREFGNGNVSTLSELISHIDETDIRYMTKMPGDNIAFQFDYIMNIINKIIHNTLDNKDEIIKNSPTNYSQRINSIFSLLTNRYPISSIDFCTHSIKTTPFFKYIDAKTRDRILTDFIFSPNGSISSRISEDSPSTLLSLCLVFDDLKAITKILSRTKDDKSDEYGFIPGLSVNFPASLTQKSRKVEEYKGTLHLYEKKLIPLLRHKSASIATNAYLLYIEFVEKLFYYSIQVNNKNLYKLAQECHFRLCRFLNANTSAELQLFVIEKFISRVCNPLSLYVGMKANETDKSDGSEEYASYLYDNVIIKFPFSVENLGLTMFPILLQIIYTSKHPKLPGIGKVGSILVDKLVNRLFNEIPATFKIPSDFYQSMQFKFHPYTYFNQLEESDIKTNENNINGFKLLINERAKLTISDALIKKILKNILTKPRKIDNGYYQYSFVDPGLVKNEYFKMKTCTKIKPGIEPFLKLLEILKEKIDSYNPDDYNHPTTTLINQFKNLIFSSERNDYQSLCFKDIFINYELPKSVIEQFDSIRTAFSTNKNIADSYSLNGYTQALNNFKTNFVLTHKTIEFIKAVLKDDIHQNFLLELIDSKSFDYDVLTKVYQFVPLTKQQKQQQEKDGVVHEKPLLDFNIYVSYISNQAFEYFLEVKNITPPVKPKKCEKCGSKIANAPKAEKKNSKINDSQFNWVDLISWRIVKPILSFNAEDFCNALQTNGTQLFKYIKILFKFLIKNNLDLNLQQNTIKLIANAEKDDSFSPINFNLVAHLLNLCIKDILIEDPEPTKENPNPKPTPTLFSNENGVIAPLLEPFSNKSTKASSSTPKLQGDQKFFSTKVLIAYLSSILSLSMTVGHVDISIFTSSLNELLSIAPADLKKCIGDDNYSLYMDHLVAMLLNHLSFGNTVKNLDWAKKFESPLFEIFFRLFTCDAAHHIALEAINKKLQNLSNVDEKNAIVSAFVSVLSSTEMNFTLHTRTRTAAWCADLRYVGNPLPQYSIDFLDSLASDEKCHIDIRKTVAAGVVAFFKNLAVSEANPNDQFNVLFDILKKLYSKSKVLMTPFFCQLLKPSFCFSLAKSLTSYASLMPTKSLPEALLTSLPFGVISMPQDERFENDSTVVKGENVPKSWKEAYDLYLASFIGSSLLLKEENILQLVIQVLTYVQARGGTTAVMISKFIVSILSDSNLHRLSSILIKFIFGFCLQNPHKDLDKLVDSFISIFNKLRQNIDEIGEKQSENLWINKENFAQTNYETVNMTCSSFINSFEEVIDNLHDKDDILNAHEIAKRIVKEMDGEKHPSIFIESFMKLRYLFYCLADDDLAKVLPSLYSSDESNEEENLITLLKFVRKSALLNEDFYYPKFVKKAFKKNINGLSVKVMNELTEWPIEVCNSNKAKDAIFPLIGSFRTYILIPASKSQEGISPELKEVIDKLWYFGRMNISSTYQSLNFSDYQSGGRLASGIYKFSDADILKTIKDKKKVKKAVPSRRGRGRRGRK